MPEKHPPHISVQHFTREQKEAGLVPGVPKGGNQPEAVILSPTQPGSPPTSDAPVIGEPESSDVLESAPPAQENVPQLDSGTPDNIEDIEEGEVLVKGKAAIALARMIGLEAVWNIETGEILPLSLAIQRPHLAVIDFNALRESIEGFDSNAVEDLINSIPEPRPDPNAKSREAFVQPPAGPGITVRQYPGLVRVEVEGPVKVTRARQGNTRIMQLSYYNVEVPKVGQKAQRVTAKASAVRPIQTQKVQMRNISPNRTVPRQIPKPVESTPEPEDFIDDDYEF